MSGEGFSDGKPFAVACLSVRGQRPKQEDTAGWLSLRESLFLVVADGMGGLEQGAFAARKACETFLRAGVTLVGDTAEPERVLQDAAAVANGLLLQAQQRYRWTGIGTTVAAALLRDSRLVVAHAGDSRVYLVTTDDVTLLTRDHSPAQELLREGGALTLPQARQMAGTGVTRCLGDEEFPGLEIQHLGLRDGAPAFLVLTTDGAHEFLEANDFLHQAAGSASAEDYVRRLVSLASLRGSTDNITVLAAELGTFPRSRVPAAPVAPGLEVSVQPQRRAVGLLVVLAASLLGFVAGQQWAAYERTVDKGSPSAVAPSPTPSPTLLTERSHEHR